MNRALRICAALVSMSASAAEPNWIAMQNEHFHVYSSAGERDTRQMLGQFERVRGFFFQVARAATESSTPVTVVIFGTAKEYQPYRFNNSADAYYTRRGDRDFIVVGEVGEQSSLTASHEYTHLAFEHAGFSLPPWLGEGIAELFSTLRAHGSDTVFGETLPGRLQELREGQWVPLETILTADKKSPYYNEAKKADSFYDESWALVHMLMTTNQYRGKFWEALSSIDKGTPSVKALETTYGMPLAKLEEALRSYILGNRYNMLKVSIPLEATDKVASQPADRFEVRELQAELLMGINGRQDEARQRLGELTREDASRPGPWANLGYIAWRDGHTDEAAEDFGKAFDRGDRNPRLIMDLAQAYQGTKPERSMEALRALLEAHTDDIDARLFLASLQMSQDRVADAVATIRVITAVRTSEQRDELLYLRAFAALKLGNAAAARANAEQLKQVTTSEHYKSRADEVIQMSAQK